MTSRHPTPQGILPHINLDVNDVTRPLRKAPVHLCANCQGHTTVDRICHGPCSQSYLRHRSLQDISGIPSLWLAASKPNKWVIWRIFIDHQQKPNKMSDFYPNFYFRHQRGNSKAPGSESTATSRYWAKVLASWSPHVIHPTKGKKQNTIKQLTFQNSSAKAHLPFSRHRYRFLSWMMIITIQGAQGGRDCAWAELGPKCPLPLMSLRPSANQNSSMNHDCGTILLYFTWDVEILIWLQIFRIFLCLMWKIVVSL